MNTLSPDQEFEHPRLASLYDALAGDRPDLEPYLSMVEEFKPSSVLDLGCGTGTLLSKLTDKNIELVGVDPAEASLNLAMQKTVGKQITWVLGGPEAIPPIPVDMALMTGNVAQVFLSDRDWSTTLDNIHNALTASGILVFETRNPDAQCWKQWTRKQTFRSSTFDNIGHVDSWCDVINESLPYVSFKWTYVFESDGAILTSESTIRFRERSEIEESLTIANFDLIDVRDAADRPGRELVFIAKNI